MGKYVRLPIPIEAVQFDDTVECLEALSGMGIEPAVAAGNSGPELVIKTGIGMVNIPVGWWILKGAGEFFPCSPEAFNDAYCPVPATEIEQEWHFGQGGLYINDARGRNLFYACLADFRQMQLAMAAPELYAVLSEMVNIGYKHEEGCWPSEGQHTEGCLKKQAALNKARTVLGRINRLPMLPAIPLESATGAPRGERLC